MVIIVTLLATIDQKFLGTVGIYSSSTEFNFGEIEIRSSKVYSDQSLGMVEKHAPIPKVEASWENVPFLYDN